MYKTDLPPCSHINIYSLPSAKVLWNVQGGTKLNGANLHFCV